jgi:hypothetical protein
MKHRLIVALAALLLLGGSLLFYLQSPRQKAPSSTEKISPPRVALPAHPVPPIARTVSHNSTTNAPAAPSPAVSSEDPRRAFAAFAEWADRFRAGDRSVDIARGEALAWKRREAMEELIENDPAKALALTVPFEWREALPEKITRFFEEQVDGRGALNVAVATDFDNNKTTVMRTAQIGGTTYQTFVYGRRTAEVSKQNIPLHGIALTPRSVSTANPSADSAPKPIPAPKLALSSEPIRLLTASEAAALEKKYGQPPDTICGVSGQPADYRQQEVAAEIGGEVRHFCGVDHLKLVNESWRLAESGGSGGGIAGDAAPTLADDRWTHGPKTLLYMRLNFPDDLTEPISEADAYSVMDGVNRFFTDTSYNLTAIDATVTPLLTLPETKGWYGTAGPFALLDDARAVAQKAGFDTANYDRDIASFTTVPGFDFGGLAYVHGKGVWLQSPGVKVTAHELGHNYGLYHANFWDTGIFNYSSAISPGTNIEYGNIFDTMGFGNGQYNAVHKNTLDWIPNSSVYEVISNGVYRIHAYDRTNRVNGRFYAAKVRKDYQRTYWIEFRVEETFNPASQNGVLLNWAAWDQSNGGTSLLDTTPGTLDVNDSALVIGRTFDDASAGVHITPLARGSTGLEPYMDVQVNLGAFPANSPPLMKVEIDPTNAVPGQLVHFHATASDPDGDTLAYAWTFDDGTFSTNNQPWVAKSWSKSGDHVVRCVVSDMKGGHASVNTIAHVGGSSGFRVSGVVLDENADPIEGVRVDTGILNTNVPYVSAWSDSDGYFVLTGITNDLPLEANSYGYSFSNQWQNPLPVSANVSNVLILGTRFGQVTLTASTNLVYEASPTPNQLTLTRADTNDDLSVTLFVSGTATVPGDLTFNPPLISGENTVVIPAGVNHLTFTFTPVNDALAEGTETAIITVVDSTNYFIAPLAEASISIIDKDSGTLPAVSVEAQNSLIMEGGPDSGIFVFTRTGLTNLNLQVFYSVSGTATPGTDYPALLGVVTIPAGSQSAAVQFRPFDDKDVEPDETVIVTITPNAAYTVSGAPATTTIANDDLLTVTISPTLAPASEPSTSGRFTVKRDGDLTGNLVVYYTLSGTASNGVDYVSPSGAVTIPANQTSADIVITPIDDLLVEGDESVIATLVSNPAYNIGDPGIATLFIHDNEKPTVTITAPDPNAAEPGSDFGQFQISRGSVVNGNLTVNFNISGTALNGIDYVPLDNFAVIPDGANSVTLDVIPFDDLQVEPTESVILTLAPSTNYNIGTPNEAEVDIEDDDTSTVPAVGFCFSTSSALESESPGICVSLSQTSSVPVTVNYRILGGTASNNIDYVLPPGPLTFAPGEFAKSIPLNIIDDALIEPNETIRIALYDPTNATLDGIKIHTYTIIDNDTSSLSVTATANASETGSPGNFRITRTGSTNASQTVNFQITGTASAPSDFAPLGTSTTIPAGAAFVDVPVIPVNDSVVEMDETVVMTLISAPASRIVAPASATVTISDDDSNSLPVVSISSTNRPNAFEGGGNGEFVFTRTGSTVSNLSFNVTILGTAANGVDYTTLPNVVTIPAGQSSVTIPVVPIDDNLVEGDETVTLALEIRDTYRVSTPAFATVTIQDNDQNVRIDASDFEAVEAGPVPDYGAFTFTRFGTTNLPVQIFFTITGTAINGVDYVTLSNSIVIPAGSLAATLPVIPINDTLVEGPETVTLTLQANPAYVLASPTTATVTIEDDEPSVSIYATVPTATEGYPQPGVFTLVRGGNPDNEFTARLSIGGTATYGVDYPPFVTNVFFPYGVVSIDLIVAPTNDLVVEGNETVVATLVPNPAYSIVAPNSAVITIKDAGANRGPNVVITSPTAKTVFLLGTNVNMILEATVTDDAGTNATLTMTWTNISGPDSLSFGATDTNNTTVTFTNGGVYVLRLTVDDGVLTNYDEVTVMVDTLGLLSTNRLYWPLDQTSGTAVPDVSSNGHAGTITGPANWVTNGAVGGALRLTGTNNFVRETPPSGFLNGLKQFSLALWVKNSATNVSGGIFTGDDSGSGPSLTLATRATPAFGTATNAIEAALVTTRGQARHVSLSNAVSNDWQHIAITWSNGLFLSLFVNGQLDQPNSRMVPLVGVVTNCPQFVIGKGPSDIANTWKGFVDDVRVFPRALQPTEVAGLVATNYAPVVTVDTNLTVQVVTPVDLTATVTDDGRPNPPGVVTTTWSQISGPLPVSLPDPSNLTNTVQFIQSGDYVFRLIADDGQVKIYNDLTVTVVEPTSVSVIASDPDAAELGQDPGEFTFSRVGDLNFNLTIQVTMSGSASNGADFVFIPQTNVITLPTGVDTTKITVTPFLDHRTEGDETVTYTIVSNLAYTISGGEATVVIHDSPYGMWNIAHFTLEELTDPNLSGEGADFDHDHLQNFAEYAFNRDPKAPETNSPISTAIELNPADSKNHITITYQRRIAPTDAAYEVRVSNDLRTWNSGPAYVEELQATDDGNNLTETVKARVVAPWPAVGNAQFITIRVWLKTTGP